MSAALNEQDEWARDKIEAAVEGSRRAIYRVQLMRAVSIVDPPRVTKEKMPFSGHRNCSQWKADR